MLTGLPCPEAPPYTWNRVELSVCRRAGVQKGGRINFCSRLVVMCISFVGHRSNKTRYNMCFVS